MEKGVEIGDANQLRLKVDLLCSNKTAEEMDVATFKMWLYSQANLTVSNFVVYPELKSVTPGAAEKLRDIIGLEDVNIEALFQGLSVNYANNFNALYSKGWPLANINPQFAMLGGLIKNSTVTPYVSDGWLYGGFSMQADLPTMPVNPIEPELQFLQI
mmetsp:Transcript_5416/g.9110  ORF Transcript_5416/g.9110 Transcript_5416/m.9110 type:complete len:158 (+) Transcript_5416:1181-1654(+)